MSKLKRVLASRSFLYCTIALLAVQALWIALTARYPQAFDEQVHFGLIQLHAHSWLPFFSNQPAGADAYGAVVRDPSYLYHYLLSFPYRLLTHLTNNQIIQIVALRALNIALLCSAIPIYRRVLRRIGLSAALTNSVLFVLVITPVAPLLAGQINYDNMVVPLTGMLVLLCLRLQQAIRARETVSPLYLGVILTVACLGSIVKYAYLPVAAVAFVYVAWQLLRQHIRLSRFIASFKTALVVVLCLLSLGLFSERYGVNMVRYHTPTPACDHVLSEKRCKAYSPWFRNRYLATHNKTPSPKQIAGFPGSWLGRVIEESLFAIGSGFNNGVDVTTNNFGAVDYWQARSLVVPRLLTLAGLGLGVLAFGWQARSLLARPALRLSLIFSVTYIAVLFLLNLRDFVHIGVITAVHGRYVLPILPIVLGVFALALQKLLTRPQVVRVLAPPRQLAIVLAVVLIFWFQGGGLVTYIVRSEHRWFWPQSSVAQTVNAHVQRTLKHLVLGSNMY